MLAIVATLLVFDAIDTSKHRYFNLAFVALMAGDIPLSRGLPTLSELESSSFGHLARLSRRLVVLPRRRIRGEQRSRRSVPGARRVR